ncbi:MAG: hypothetical protein HQL09_10270, partial [Nitrospirae bacterium]|nr:hypothetical protein [Nitrospirota bacterium]
MKISKIVGFFIISFVQAAICVSSSFALISDGGTIAACYPGGFHQVLAGVKPFVAPCAQYTPIGTCSHLSNLVTYWLPLYAIEVTGQEGTTIFPVPSSFVSVLQQATESGSMVQGEPGNDMQTKY